MTDRSGGSERDVLDERMDRRLSEYGVRWRAVLPEPAEPTPVAGSSRRSWLVPAAAAAAVAAVVGVSFAVTAGDDRDDAPPSSRPTSERPPPCETGDLVLGAREVERAAGTTYLTATIQLATDGSTCIVSGAVPEVIVLEGGAVAPVEVAYERPTDPDRAFAVTETEAVQVTLSWAVGHFCGDVDNDKILLRVGGRADVEFDGFGPTSCSPGEGAPAVVVEPLRTFGARQPGVLTGVVTVARGPDGARRPVKGGLLSASGDTGTFSAVIGDDGRYEIELPAGAYELSITTSRGRSSFDCYDTASVTGDTVNEADVSC